MTDRKQWKSGLSIGRLSEESLDAAAKAGLDLVEIGSWFPNGKRKPA